MVKNCCENILAFITVFFSFLCGIIYLGGSMNKSKIKLFILILIVIFLICYLLYQLNIIPHFSYSNNDFGISDYISNIDKDKDGIDDQTDILNNVKK